MKTKIILSIYSLLMTLILIKEGVAFNYAVKAYNCISETKTDQLSEDMIAKLALLEDAYGSKIIVTSGKRNKGGTSSHEDGTAVDIRSWDGRSRYNLVAAAQEVGFNRIGVYDRHIHVDIAKDRRQNTIWIGESK